MVCVACHKGIGGGLSVNSTGEFRVPTAAELLGTSDGIAEAHPNVTRPNTVGACSWCGKLEREVQKLLGRGNIALCNECVSLCSDILDAELGEAWR